MIGIMRNLEKRTRMIIKRRCDIPMARRKGILGRCNRQCRTCLCCIVMGEGGIEHHVTVSHGGDPNLQARNLERLSLRTIMEEVNQSESEGIFAPDQEIKSED